VGETRVVNKPEYTSVRKYSIFAVFDLELTGLNGDEDRVIEPAIVLADEDGQPRFAWETLIDPERDTGPVHIHNITNEMVANAPKFAEVADDMVELFNGRVIVGLNNSLDFQCLKREFDALGIKFRPGDSLDLSALLRDEKFTDLYYEEIMAAINSQEIEHRAMADTLVAVAILPYALQFAKDYPERVRPYTQCSVVAYEREPLSRPAISNRIGYMAPE
jgi:DNA polymerase-3 subunit epsilon